MPDAKMLTPRQRDIAVLVAQGCSDKEIADRLTLSVGTVANHMRYILKRLGLRNRVELAGWTVRNGLHHSRTED